MSKETEETIEDAFSALSFLSDTALKSQPNGKDIKQKEIKAETKLNETLTEVKETPEEIAAKKEIDDNLLKKEKASKKVTEEVIEEEEEEQEETDKGIFVTLIDNLKDEGILKLPEDFEYQNDDESLYKAINLTAKSKLDSWKQSLDEDSQKYLEFVENGGRPSDFHKYYYNNSSSFEDFDITDEDNQKHAIAEGLRLSGIDDEDEINDQLELFEDAGKLESKAKMYLGKLQKAEKDQKETLVQIQKDYAKNQEIKRKNEWDEFRDGLYKADEIGGFKFTKKMKDDTWEYMTKADRKTGKTQYQIDSEELGNNARYMAAFLQMKKWDKEELEREVKTKEVSKLKDKLNNYSDKIIKNKQFNIEKKKVDPEQGNFDVWKNFL